MTSRNPSLRTAKIEWATKLGDDAQKLLSAYNSRYDQPSIKQLADELTVGQTRDIFKEMEAEFVRLEDYKAALISAKEQLKAAVMG